MIKWIPLLALLSLTAATYLSALSLALLDVSRSELQRRLEALGKEALADWLFDRLNPASLAVALLRTTARVAVTVCVIAWVMRLENSATLTWGSLLLAGGISAALMWLFTSVLAGAMARHSAVALVSTALPWMRIIHAALLPITKTVGFIDVVVRRLSGADQTGDDEAEEDLLRSIEDTQQQGVLDEQAAQMLENVVEFRNTEVGEIMTPRTDIQGIALTNDLAAIRDAIGSAGHSRIPVYRNNLDHIVGVLYVKDLIIWVGRDPAGFQLEPLLRRPIVVPASKPIRSLLAEFRQSEVHMAIVIDEYGGTAGLITIEDVLEEIVGDIRDEHEPADETEPTLTVIDETRAEMDGRFHIFDLNSRLGLHLPEDGDYDTVAGFLLAQLGRVPAAGESIASHDARFTVLEATPTNIKRIGVELLPAAPAATAAAEAAATQTAK